MKDYLKVFTIQLSTNQYNDQRKLASPQKETLSLAKKQGPTETIDTERGERIQIAYDPLATKDINCFRTLVDLAKEEGYDAILVHPADALVYDSHPELALPGGWTKLELQNELDHARDLELLVFPMLNFSAAHDVWLGEYARMISTPDYYQVCGDLIDELCELFESPRYFHLGLNGENDWEQSQLDYAVVRGDRLMIHDMQFFMKHCRDHGAIPWLSSDFAIEHLACMEQAVPKDVLLSHTQASERGRACLSPSEKAFIETARLGYTGMMPTLSGYFNLDVPNQQMQMVKEHLAPECVFGFVADGYLRCEEKNRCRLMDEVVRSMRAFRSYLSSLHAE